jgi:hypothetical protein
LVSSQVEMEDAASEVSTEGQSPVSPPNVLTDGSLTPEDEFETEQLELNKSIEDNKGDIVPVEVK